MRSVPHSMLRIALVLASITCALAGSGDCGRWSLRGLALNVPFDQIRQTFGARVEPAGSPAKYLRSWRVRGVTETAISGTGVMYDVRHPTWNTIQFSVSLGTEFKPRAVRAAMLARWGEPTIDRAFKGRSLAGGDVSMWFLGGTKGIEQSFANALLDYEGVYLTIWHDDDCNVDATLFELIATSQFSGEELGRTWIVVRDSKAATPPPVTPAEVAEVSAWLDSVETAK